MPPVMETMETQALGLSGFMLLCGVACIWLPSKARREHGVLVWIQAVGLMSALLGVLGCARMSACLIMSMLR